MKPYPLLGVVVWWLLSALTATAANARRVPLILNPYGRDVEPFCSAVASFRLTLAREMGTPLDFYEVPMELTRFNGGEEEAALVAFLEDRMRSQPVDLVVPFGAAGMPLGIRHRSRLFRATPLVLTAIDPQFVFPEFLPTNTTLVTQ